MLETEYKRIIERETEFIVNLCEAKEVEAVPGIEFKDGLMIVPEPKTDVDQLKPK